MKTISRTFTLFAFFVCAGTALRPWGAGAVSAGQTSGAPLIQITASNQLVSATAFANSTFQPAVRQVQVISGNAFATFGRQKVGFSDLNNAEPIAITTPDNQTLAFRPTLLAYYDVSSGETVPLAQIQDCNGQVQLPNNLFFAGAFSNLNAGVQYICTQNSLEQNILLAQQPPPPETFGLNPQTTRLEVWTEWFDSRPVRMEESVVTLRSATNGISAVTATDTSIDFGTMKLVHGRAFSLPGMSNSVAVAKEWADMQGRKFLLESVDYEALAPALRTLTAAHTPSVKKIYANREEVARSLVQNVSKPKAGFIKQFANAGAIPAKGVILDFTILDSTPLPAGAISWWPAGGNANDVVGTNNGTMEPGSSFAAGEVGQGFAFDGNSGYVEVPDNDVWAFGTNSFTIEGWVNFSSLQENHSSNFPDEAFVGSDEGGGDVNKWIFDLANGSLRFLIDDPVLGVQSVGSAPFSPTTNTWYHLAVTRNGTNYTFYVNGAVAGSGTSSRVIPNAAAPLTIGQAEGIGFVDGEMDEFTIYSRALSGSEISAIYTAGGAGKDNPDCTSPPANIIGWWPGDGDADDLASTNNGMLEGVSTNNPGEVAQAFDLNGSSGYVQVPDNDAWAFGTNDFSIELWA